VKDSLPIIDAEIADTWIHGAGTDPKKEAHYRELLRLRRAWLEQGMPEDQLRGFSRKLLQVPEHTWGLDVKTHLNDWKNYSAPDFQSIRDRPNFRKMEQSWDEQRGYLRSALAALPAHLKQEAARRLSMLTPTRPDPQGYSSITDFKQPIPLGVFQTTLDAEHGWLTGLSSQDVPAWGKTAPLGKFWYETFSANDYRRFHRQYNVNKRETNIWAIPDFTKPGIDEAAPEHHTYLPQLTWAGWCSDDQQDTLLIQLEMPTESSQSYGAPQMLTLEVSASKSQPALDFKLQWFNKPACRLPEALWFSFLPSVKQYRQWKMEKLGQWVSPYAVIRDGNRHLHALGDGGFRLDEAGETIQLASLDAVLAAPGQPMLLDFNNRQPNLKQGLHFNLYNNQWGTNFPMWYEEDALFRFTLRFQ
jgi:hypothetical protein